MAWSQTLKSKIKQASESSQASRVTYLSNSLLMTKYFYIEVGKKPKEKKACKTTYNTQTACRKLN